VKLREKKINAFGKSIPVIAIILMVLTAGIAGAALLNYYGKITGTVDVAQSVLVDGKNYTQETVYNNTIVAGSSVISAHTLKNRAEVPATVRLNTTYSPDGEGITTTYVGELTLTQKTVVFGSAPWVIPENAENVTVSYTIVGDVFSAEVKEPIVGYTLIYYADDVDRFNNYSKGIPVSEVDGNLPYSDDENAEGGANDYSNEYVTPHGAKLWYIPESAIQDGNIDWGRASEFYFETALIQYNKDGIITVYPGQTLGFNIVTDFNVALTPAECTITTTVEPVV